MPLMVISPLTFLGGTFYSIDMLPPFWRNVALFNPRGLSGRRLPLGLFRHRRRRSGDQLRPHLDDAGGLRRRRGLDFPDRLSPADLSARTGSDLHQSGMAPVCAANATRPASNGREVLRMSDKGERVGERETNGSSGTARWAFSTWPRQAASSGTPMAGPLGSPHPMTSSVRSASTNWRRAAASPSAPASSYRGKSGRRSRSNCAGRRARASCLRRAF